jgi:hypothetical protein
MFLPRRDKLSWSIARGCAAHRRGVSNDRKPMQRPRIAMSAMRATADDASICRRFCVHKCAAYSPFIAMTR